MTSPDGITWTAHTSPNSGWSAITYGNGLFVAVAWFGTNLVMTSPDGITWTERTSTIGDWRAITYANGFFVVVGRTVSRFDHRTHTYIVDSTIPRVMNSPDGINWTPGCPMPTGNGDWSGIAFGNGKFVAVSNAQQGVNRVVVGTP